MDVQNNRSKDMKILVYDDMREFPSNNQYIQDAEIIYCKTEAEFLVWLSQDEAEHGTSTTAIDVLVLDHDLGLQFFGAEENSDTTRRSIARYYERIISIPEKERPQVFIVTANPAGRAYFYSMFRDVCNTIVDPNGTKLGMKWPG